MREIAILLHNVRSAHNVGSIFRTGDAARVSRIFLSGYTPVPIDRFGRVQKEISKTALGAEKTLMWEYYVSSTPLITRLKKEGWRIIGVEQDERAKNFRSFQPSGRTLFIFGNEVRGLSKQLRHLCDALVEIPMRGTMVRQAHHPKNQNPEHRRGKESLNVSVAAGIILFNT